MKGDMCHLLVSVSEALLLLLKAEAKSLDCCLIVVTSFFVSKKWFPPLLCFRVICLDSLMRSCVLAFSFLNLFFVVFSTWALQATASASNNIVFVGVDAVVSVGVRVRVGAPSVMVSIISIHCLRRHVHVQLALFLA